MNESHKVLALSTVSFTLCFAVWMLNGVLITFLVDNNIFRWDSLEIGWLMGVPILTGAICRLPAGILADRFGGRFVFAGLMLLSSIGLFLLSHASTYTEFVLCSLVVGFCGACFSVGVSFVSSWYPKEKLGFALGVFGAGNAGAAITTMIAPTLLDSLTEQGAALDNWRKLPIIYAAVLLTMSFIFIVLTKNKKREAPPQKFRQLLSPLKDVRVWRFGLYYFLVFGCFVAFSQWLVPYYVNVYHMPLVTAGFLASLFSFPSGVIRVLGGFLSDKMGARRVMYWVLGGSAVLGFLLCIPQMEIYTPGKGVMVKNDGKVTSVSKSSIEIGKDVYEYDSLRPTKLSHEENLIWPYKETWQEPVVQVGDQVVRRQLLAKGKTIIYFQANVWVYTAIVILIGITWGVGKAAVYKHIPNYFPDQVGVVGGMVGVIGGLGGFFSPIIFGYILDLTGLWTSSWMFILSISLVCLIWMHLVITRMMNQGNPQLKEKIDTLKEQS